MINLELPYNPADLRPDFSVDGFNQHYQLYLTYQSNLSQLTTDNIFDRTDLTSLLKITKGTLLFNAIQVWNHIFFFTGLKPGGSYLGPGSLRLAINGCFGSYQSFKELFIKYGNRGEASGWIWLVVNAEGAIEITRDHGLKHPLLRNTFPLFSCDLFPHAFEKDFGSDRESYLEAIVRLADWELVETRFLNALKRLSRILTHSVSDKSAMIL